MNYTLSEVVNSNLTFLDYLKTRTELYHQSNVFFRDFQYGIMEYGKSKGKKISYGRAEELARELVSTLEQTGLLRRITPGSWMLNYPQFRKPSSKSEAASKPSSGPAVAKTAIATPSSGLASPSSSGTMTPS
jgi:hypothetical protein